MNKQDIHCWNHLPHSKGYIVCSVFSVPQCRFFQQQNQTWSTFPSYGHHSFQLYSSCLIQLYDCEIWSLRITLPLISLVSYIMDDMCRKIHSEQWIRVIKKKNTVSCTQNCIYPSCNSAWQKCRRHHIYKRRNPLCLSYCDRKYKMSKETLIEHQFISHLNLHVVFNLQI